MSYYLQWLKRAKFDPEFGHDIYRSTDPEDTSEMDNFSKDELPNVQVHKHEEISNNRKATNEIYTLDIQEHEDISRECSKELSRSKRNPANRGKPATWKRGRQKNKEYYSLL